MYTCLMEIPLTVVFDIRKMLVYINICFKPGKSLLYQIINVKEREVRGKKEKKEKKRKTFFRECSNPTSGFNPVTFLISITISTFLPRRKYIH